MSYFEFYYVYHSFLDRPKDKPGISLFPAFALHLTVYTLKSIHCISEQSDSTHIFSPSKKLFISLFYIEFIQTNSCSSLIKPQGQCHCYLRYYH